MTQENSGFRGVLCIFPLTFFGVGVIPVFLSVLISGNAGGDIDARSALAIVAAGGLLLTFLASLGYASVIQARWEMVRNLKTVRLAAIQIAVALLSLSAVWFGESLMVFGILVLPPVLTYLLVSAAGKSSGGVGGSPSVTCRRTGWM